MGKMYFRAQRVCGALALGLGLLAVTACGTETTGAGGESEAQDATATSAMDGAVVCADNTEWEPMGESGVREHLQSNEEFGSDAPHEILQRMAQGRDSFSGQQGTMPSGSRKALLETFSRAAETAASGDSSASKTSVVFEYEKGPDRGTLEAYESGGRWFPQSLNLSTPCRPFDFDPTDERLESFLTLSVEPRTAAPGSAVQIGGLEDLDSLALLAALRSEPAGDGWPIVGWLTPGDDEEGLSWSQGTEGDVPSPRGLRTLHSTEWVIVPADLTSGTYLLCVEDSFRMGTDTEARCGRLDVEP